MRRGLILAAVLIGTWLVLPVAAQNYVWTAVNGIPMAPSLILDANGLLRFGGTTSSFPALKRGSGSLLEARAADDSGLVRMDMSALQLGGVMVMTSGTPTIGSGFGTSPSVVAGKAYAFTVNVGTGGTATSGVITMPTASTGWICDVENQTATAANVGDARTVQIANTTTSVTVENQTISTGAALAWTASDVLLLACTAF